MLGLFRTFSSDALVHCSFRISRGDTPADCPVHFFTSHFFSTLSKHGAKAVTSWTARKKIDVFSKRFIFIPINKSLHWSLCVVVNPGYILNQPNKKTGNPPADSPLPCILFMDSLKAHQKSLVANTVREWLNSEWRRLGKDEGASNPFLFRTMPVFDPRSKCALCIVCS